MLISWLFCDHLWAPSCQIFSLRARLREQDCLWSNTPTMDAFAPHRIIASLQQLISFVCEWNWSEGTDATAVIWVCAIFFQTFGLDFSSFCKCLWFILNRHSIKWNESLRNCKDETMHWRRGFIHSFISCSSMWHSNNEMNIGIDLILIPDYVHLRSLRIVPWISVANLSSLWCISSWYRLHLCLFLNMMYFEGLSDTCSDFST